MTCMQPLLLADVRTFIVISRLCEKPLPEYWGRKLGYLKSLMATLQFNRIELGWKLRSGSSLKVKNVTIKDYEQKYFSCYLVGLYGSSHIYRERSFHLFIFSLLSDLSKSCRRCRHFWRISINLMKPFPCHTGIL